MTFNEQCYELLKQIPKGKVTTYKEMARALGNKAYRAVGNAMASNPTPIIVPCHRVVNTDGRVGKFALGQAKKIELLISEGINIQDNKITNLKEVFHSFASK